MRECIRCGAETHFTYCLPCHIAVSGLYNESISYNGLTRKDEPPVVPFIVSDSWIDDLCQSIEGKEGPVTW
jgi:hypothetical protein